MLPPARQAAVTPSALWPDLVRSMPPVVGILVAVLFATVATIAAPAARAFAGASYSRTHLVVEYAAATPARARAAVARAASADGVTTLAPQTRLLRLRAGVSVASALARIRGQPDVVSAVPDYRAHIAGELIPNDLGTSTLAGGWEQLQWNFAGPFGVNAPEAWANLIADGAPGGAGVVVAVLDTGVAYANRGRFVRSPDFLHYGFVRGYDFVAHG